jgi:hypothetical protein
MCLDGEVRPALSSEKPSHAQLASLNESLRLRLAEAEAALQVLRAGKVDPDVVSSLDQSRSPGDFLAAGTSPDVSRRRRHCAPRTTCST